MGPNLIFDKSFLQSLSDGESVWLEMFFSSNITPLFFVETLADLEKEMKEGRTPEGVVGHLAAKTPDMDVRANVHHRTLLFGELTGSESIDMKYGRPIVGGGSNRLIDGRRGVVFEQSPEEEALDRWTSRNFLDIERVYAKKWRQALLRIAPWEQSAMFLGWHGEKRPRDLSEVKAKADAFIDGENRRSALTFGLSLLDVHPEAAKTVVRRWELAGSPAIADFAPYFRHVFSIDLFFYLARSAGMISDRRTNQVDIAYLYYLPFCLIFTSSDRLHRATVPLFCRPDQSFVWGWELKKDLSLLDQYYNALPADIKSRGLLEFASHPPVDDSFLVTRLWDKHWTANWRTLSKPKRERNNDAFENELLERVRRDAEAPGVAPDMPRVQSDKLDYIVTKHKVPMKKGKWNRFPPEVKPYDPEK